MWRISTFGVNMLDLKQSNYCVIERWTSTLGLSWAVFARVSPELRSGLVVGERIVFWAPRSQRWAGFKLGVKSSVCGAALNTTV